MSSGNASSHTCVYHLWHLWHWQACLVFCWSPWCICGYFLSSLCTLLAICTVGVVVASGCSGVVSGNVDVSFVMLDISFIVAPIWTACWMCSRLWVVEVSIWNTFLTCLRPGDMLVAGVFVQDVFLMCVGDCRFWCLFGIPCDSYSWPAVVQMCWMHCWHHWLLIQLIWCIMGSPDLQHPFVMYFQCVWVLGTWWQLWHYPRLLAGMHWLFFCCDS